MKFPHSCMCLIAAISAIGSATAADSKAVSLQADKSKKTVTVKIGDEVFTVFNLSNELPKPFAAPVHGPGGTVMTRAIFQPGVKIDHPHHKGIWVSVDEVNKIKFWAEQGKIVNVKSEIKSDGKPAGLTLVNHWMGAGENSEPLLEETCDITIFPNRMMVYDITFKAMKEPVVFEDTKEGLFGFRMVDSMKESEGGKVINSDGLKGTKEAWGKTADWVDYYGEIDGKTFGVTLMDHPDNFRPSRYHVRNYGLFSVSPFGEQAYAKAGEKHVHLEPGKTLRLVYGIYIHAGTTESAKVADVYQDFVKSVKSSR